jgi:hypothetical protein
VEGNATETIGTTAPFEMAETPPAEVPSTDEMPTGHGPTDITQPGALTAESGTMPADIWQAEAEPDATPASAASEEPKWPEAAADEIAMAQDLDETVAAISPSDATSFEAAAEPRNLTVAAAVPEFAAAETEMPSAPPFLSRTEQPMPAEAVPALTQASIAMSGSSLAGATPAVSGAASSSPTPPVLVAVPRPENGVSAPIISGPASATAMNAQQPPSTVSPPISAGASPPSPADPGPNAPTAALSQSAPSQSAPSQSAPSQSESPPMSASMPATGIASPETANAAAGSVTNLVRALTSDRGQQVFSGGPTIADLVREEMRPMLKAWLDSNLPPLVERLVRAEIERVISRAAV